MIKYKVSEKEIIRRKKAFLSLSISLLLGSFFASILFVFPISYLFFSLFTLILLILNLWLNKFFNKYLKMNTYLSKEFLIRGKGKFLIKNINKLTIKRTTNNTIREIRIFFDNGKSLFINGLNNFEKFEKNLLKKVNRNVMVKNIREPMDFDSVYFYPILGLILSFEAVYFFKLITNFNYQTIQIILYVSIAYVFLMAVYFIISKPISKRY